MLCLVVFLLDGEIASGRLGGAELILVFVWIGIVFGVLLCLKELKKSDCFLFCVISESFIAAF